MRSRFIASCAAAALWLGSTTDGIAAGGPFTRGCAARDIQVMMMLEAGAISPQKRSEVVRTVVHARMMCFDGHVVDALVLYDNIAQSIASDWALSGQP